MPAIGPRVPLLTQLFLAAAHADNEFNADESLYVRELLQDLLCVAQLPDEIEGLICDFDPAEFNLLACAEDFLSEPPMSKRRLLELVTYVALADGEVAKSENHFIVDLAAALRMDPGEYQDLLRVPDDERLRESFADLARVPLPSTRP